MMIATLRWRDEFKVEDAMKETFSDVFNGFGHLYGHDKEGHPVVCATLSPFIIALSPDYARSYNIYGGNNDLATAFSDVQRFIRYVSELLPIVFDCNSPPTLDGAWH